MIGSMIAVRDGTHFDVDVLPHSVNPKVELVVAAVRPLRDPDGGARPSSATAGISPCSASRQRSEISGLPMLSIYIAWPIAGATWVLFLGEKHLGRSSAYRAGARVMGPGEVAAILFGIFARAGRAARAGRLRAGPGGGAGLLHRGPADPGPAAARDVQELQRLRPAGGAVLPAGRQPDERRRHHRPAGAASRARWSATCRAGSATSTSSSRCCSPASPARRPRMPPASARC